MTTADTRPMVELPSGPLATGLRIGGRVVEDLCFARNPLPLPGATTETS